MKNHHRMGGKLDAKWMGPYTVLEKISKGRYRLQSQTGCTLAKLYNGALLKEYRTSCDENKVSSFVWLYLCIDSFYWYNILTVEPHYKGSYISLWWDSFSEHQHSPPEEWDQTFKRRGSAQKEENDSSCTKKWETTKEKTRRVKGARRSWSCKRHWSHEW